MSLNRRKFFKVVAAGAAAAMVPACLQTDIVQGKIVTPPKPDWDDPSVQLEFPLDFLKAGEEYECDYTWNIHAGRNHTPETLEAAKNAPNYHVYRLPAECEIPNKIIEGDYVVIPTYTKEQTKSIAAAMEKWEAMHDLTHVERFYEIMRKHLEIMTRGKL